MRLSTFLTVGGPLMPTPIGDGRMMKVMPPFLPLVSWVSVQGFLGNVDPNCSWRQRRVALDLAVRSACLSAFLIASA